MLLGFVYEVAFDMVASQGHLNVLREVVIPELQNSPLFRDMRTIQQFLQMFLGETFVEWPSRIGHQGHTT